MRKMLLSTVILGVACIGLGSGAQAYPIAYRTGNTNGQQFNAAADGTFTAATGGSYVRATFDYTGPLNFQVGPPTTNTNAGDLNSTFFANGIITNYAPNASTVASNQLGAPSNANFNSLASFLASSGSAYTFQYGSILSVDLGTQAAGTVLTITHDDGASVYQGSIAAGNRVGNTTAGPTGAVTETVRLTSTGQTYIVYARENGAPSVLNVAVPEPMSLGLLGAGLAGLGLIRRRKKSA